MGHKSGRVSLTDEEKLDKVHRQLRLLRKAAHSYDEGDRDAAMELAGRLRILLGDGKGNHLLKWFGRYYGRTPRFLSTPGEGGGGLGSRLVMAMGEGWTGEGSAPPQAQYFPVYGELDPKPFKYGHWWARDAIMEVDGDPLTREDLVDFMANQDGGSHQDHEVDERYAKVMRQQDLQMSFGLGNKVVAPLQGREYATIRQIAYEVQVSVKAQFGDVLREDIWFPPPAQGFKAHPGMVVDHDLRYAQSVLDDLKRKGQGDSEDVKDLERAIHWNDFSGAHRLRRRRPRTKP